jgi:outer membrane receptor protein involved in Fe transport
MKAGFEFKRHHLYFYEIDDQAKPSPLIVEYTRLPREMSAYIQDKMEYGGMIINLGLRMDYVDPNDVYPKDELHPLDENGDLLNPVKAEGKTIISPRVGMAYPVTDKTVLHFAYGQFSQVPEYQYLYDNPMRDLRHFYPNVGNPDVKPEKSSAFEIGVSQDIGNIIGIDFSGFYKDITDYVTSKLVPAVPDPYTIITNIDYANIKGITLAVNKRYSNYFSGSLNYTYQVAMGNSSDPFDMVNDVFAQPPRETDKHMLYLDWDQTHSIACNLNIGIPGNWGVNIIGELGSGLPYTPSGPLGRIWIADENSERKPMSHNVDIVAYKAFRFHRINLSLILDIRNLFNQRNHVYVYNSTGRGDTWLSPNVTDDFALDPSNFSAPRHVRLGFEIGF